MKHETLCLEECETSHSGCQVCRIEHNMPNFFPMIQATTYSVQSLCNISIEENVQVAWKNHFASTCIFRVCVCVCVYIYEQHLKFQMEWQSTAFNKTTKDLCYDQSDSSNVFCTLKRFIPLLTSY